MISGPIERCIPSMWPSASSLSGRDVHVWCADMREQWPASVLYRLLNEDEQARAGSFAFEEDRRRYLHAHGFLRMVLGCYLGRSPGAVRLTTRRNGKPCLASDQGVLRFNLSHARALVLCALACDREVGVDVEWRDRDFFWRDIASYACSEREQVVLSSLPESTQTDTFFSWWTLKEAYVKALGAGLELPLDQIDVADECEAQVPTPARGDLRDRRWAMFTIPLGSDYSGALVTEGIPSLVRCFQWSWNSDDVELIGSPPLGAMEEHHAQRS